MAIIDIQAHPDGTISAKKGSETIELDPESHFITKEDLLRPSEAREKFKEHFLKVDLDNYDKQWSSLWDDSFVPWDKMCASPSLVDLLDNKSNLPAFKAHLENPNRRALVPGCGRGYDVHLFATHGYNTIGVELSGTAIFKAKEWIASQIATHPSTKLAPTEILYGDFFESEWLKMVNLAEGEFDAIFDYAFLVAMSPTKREAWAVRMAELVKKQTGLLICLEYPLFRPKDTGGPPHGITSEDYDELLTPYFERLVRYKPQRTHKVGEGSDLVSIWRKL